MPVLSLFPDRLYLPLHVLVGDFLVDQEGLGGQLSDNPILQILHHVFGVDVSGDIGCNFPGALEQIINLLAIVH
jgi:hypothetical protein